MEAWTVQRRHGPHTSELALRVHSDPTAGNRKTTHRYWKRELADPSVQWLIPWCSFGNPYPERHERSEIDMSGFVDAEWCTGCTGLAAQ
ncbi:hypothetical protein [Amycolatopsis sp. Poz14]|uniref:hypothetical protein n=1 Tax=Amycolatopsis sp. Poz14 TaxID=1447705 RepID=UPI001EE8E299|nr:hypothetical protein [Amycolatopsis sp. Poz14]MCG3757361.1 hypothetical protein [Amycolatopsis sp. Poz14]